jgi:hypothetical protein
MARVPQTAGPRTLMVLSELPDTRTVLAVVGAGADAAMEVVKRFCSGLSNVTDDDAGLPAPAEAEDSSVLGAGRTSKQVTYCRSQKQVVSTQTSLSLLLSGYLPGTHDL